MRLPWDPSAPFENTSPKRKRGISKTQRESPSEESQAPPKKTPALNSPHTGPPMNREFNTDDPIAYLITWTTYGTWLPGDARGWNKRGKGFQPPNTPLAQSAAAEMNEPEFLLIQTERDIVEQTIRDHCDHRGWHMHAVSVRSNHVHVVVTARGYDPDTVAAQFKSWGTRRLKKRTPDRTSFWTERSSARYINTEDDLEAAIVYVLEAQDRKDRDQ